MICSIYWLSYTLLSKKNHLTPEETTSRKDKILKGLLNLMPSTLNGTLATWFNTKLGDFRLLYEDKS